MAPYIRKSDKISTALTLTVSLLELSQHVNVSTLAASTTVKNQTQRAVFFQFFFFFSAKSRVSWCDPLRFLAPL